MTTGTGVAFHYRGATYRQKTDHLGRAIYRNYPDIWHLHAVYHLILVCEGRHYLDLEKETLRDIEEQEIAIDRMQLALTEYVVKITRRELSAEQSEVLPKLLHAINDVEKLADCAATVVNAAHRSAEPGGKLSGKLKKKLEHLHERLLQMRQAVTTAFEHPGQGDAERAIAIGHWIRRNADELENEHIQHLRHAEYDLSSGMAFLAFVDAMRKISGILNNLAERAEAIAVFGGVTTGKEEEE